MIHQFQGTTVIWKQRSIWTLTFMLVLVGLSGWDWMLYWMLAWAFIYCEKLPLRECVKYLNQSRSHLIVAFLLFWNVHVRHILFMLARVGYSSSFALQERRLQGLPFGMDVKVTFHMCHFAHEYRTTATTRWKSICMYTAAIVFNYRSRIKWVMLILDAEKRFPFLFV